MVRQKKFGDPGPSLTRDLTFALDSTHREPDVTACSEDPVFRGIDIAGEVAFYRLARLQGRQLHRTIEPDFYEKRELIAGRRRRLSAESGTHSERRNQSSQYESFHREFAILQAGGTGTY
jgi:hypothetical protein